MADRHKLGESVEVVERVAGVSHLRREERRRGSPRGPQRSGLASQPSRKEEGPCRSRTTRPYYAASTRSVWDRGNTDFAFEVFADDYVRHDFRATDAAPGPEGQKQIAEDIRAAFPDLAFTVDIIIGEQEYVVGRWTATGTHSGRWAAVEPSGRQVTFSGANICRFEGGKVAEIWNHRDDLGLAEQVGAPIYAGAVPGK